MCSTYDLVHSAKLYYFIRFKENLIMCIKSQWSHILEVNVFMFHYRARKISLGIEGQRTINQEHTGKQCPDLVLCDQSLKRRQLKIMLREHLVLKVKNLKFNKLYWDQQQSVACCDISVRDSAAAMLYSNRFLTIFSPLTSSVNEKDFSWVNCSI